MFQEREQCFIDLEKWRLQHFFLSTNFCRLAWNESVGSEPSKAYCALLQEKSSDHYQIFLGLFFVESQKRRLFSLAQNFPAAKAPESLANAETFAGDMGFLLEDMHYSSGSDFDREELIRLCPFFHPSVEDYVQALSEKERSQLSQNFESTQIRTQGLQKYQFFQEQYARILSML